MDSITGPLPATSSLTAPKPAESSSTAAASKISVSRSQSTDISILTAEGDKVTLSASFIDNAEFATYDSRGSAGGSRSFERSFSFTVEGELSRKELKDIRRAIRTIEKATHDVLKGKTEKAAQRASKLERLDTIAQLQAEVEMTRKVSVETTLETAVAMPAAMPEDQQLEPAGNSIQVVKHSEFSLNLLFEMIGRLELGPEQQPAQTIAIA